VVNSFPGKKPPVKPSKTQRPIVRQHLTFNTGSGARAPTLC